MRNLMRPYDSFEGAGHDWRDPVVIVRDQPSVYRDRCGCKFIVPANAIQRHYENSFGHRWIAWECTEDSRTGHWIAKVDNRRRAVGISDELKNDLKVGPRIYNTCLKI